MPRDANAPATNLCPLCGAPVLAGKPCDYDRPEDSSPALGDYAAMHQGFMTQAEHLVVVARWFMHKAQSQGPAVLQRFQPVAGEACGKPQKLFPLSA